MKKRIKSTQKRGEIHRLDLFAFQQSGAVGMAGGHDKM